MAKMVLVCFRNEAAAESADAMRMLRRFLASLCPDNLTPAEPSIVSDGRGLLLGVFNPADPHAVRACSAYTGWLADCQESWWLPASPAPRGSYALLRGGSVTVEVLADHVASRTIWTAQTEQVFVAATSQRAIPYFLHSFVPNTTAQAWMLSAGTLGPSAAWDRRARPLAPGGIAKFDRENWRLEIREPPIEFHVDRSPDQVHADRLHDALIRTVGSMQLDLSRWVLPLSGGFDSRAILLMLKERHGLRTVTWGRAQAMRQRRSDAYVARRVAQALGVEHRYYETDLSREPVERLLDRFLTAGDGRTDGVLAYMDGFRTWRSLFESGVRGVVRGDHGFGPGPAPALGNYTQVLHFNSMTRWCDYAQAPKLAEFGLPQLGEQPLPESFAQLQSESLVELRDRLYYEYRIPVFHAGQSELKAAYVEIASPLLVRDIVDLTRTYADHLRHGKKVFRDVMSRHDVGIPYAVESALVSPQTLLAEPTVRELICDELASRRLRDAFSAPFADYLLESWSAPHDQSIGQRLWQGARRELRLRVPLRLRTRLRRRPKARVLDLRWVSLRAYLASRMLERLAIDARNRYSPADAAVPAATVAVVA